MCSKGEDLLGSLSRRSGRFCRTDWEAVSPRTQVLLISGRWLSRGTCRLTITFASTEFEKQQSISCINATLQMPHLPCQRVVTIVTQVLCPTFYHPKCRSPCNSPNAFAAARKDPKAKGAIKLQRNQSI